MLINLLTDAGLRFLLPLLAHPHAPSSAVWCACSTQYKMYPTYDLACPIVDSIEGVTHALRTNEYRDRNEQYAWFIRALGLRAPLIRDYSRLNFVYTTLSKRKLTWFVNSGTVSGWNDPRMPTIQGILRRGMTVAALRDFIALQGFSMSTNLMEWDKIWTINKKIIDPTARRFTAISTDNAVRMLISGVVEEGGVEGMTVPAHPKNAAVGVKVVTKSGALLIEQDDAATLSVGEEVTLMTLGNAVIDSITHATTPSSSSSSSPPVVTVTAHLHPSGDVKATDKKLTWVDGHPQSVADAVAIRLVELDTLINVAKVEDDMDFNTIVRPQSWHETRLRGEVAMRSITKGEVIQLNRRGYCICDEVEGKDGAAMVLFMIPDGKTKSASILASKVDKGATAGTKKDRK